MEDLLEKTDSINNNFEKTEGTNYFMKEQISAFDRPEKIDYKECHVAICPNGGLIAICKKKSFLDISKGSKLNDNILIMYQNAKQKIYIPINWEYKKRWIVYLDFNKNEKLYGICNDGTVYKMDIVTQRALIASSSHKFEIDNIIKAKFFMDGFISLTINGNFYFTKDIKKPECKLILTPECGIKYSNDIEFFCIPPDISNSGFVELFMNNTSGYGVFQIILKNIKSDYLPNNSNIEICIINENSPEAYSSQINYNKNNKSIGKICAMALSPNQKQIAFYNNSIHCAYVFPSTFDSQRKKIQFSTEDTLMDTEKESQDAVLSFKNMGQFLFCGEEALSLSGLKYILIAGITEKTKTIIYTLGNNEIQSLFGAEEGYCKCIQEVDGMRYLCNEGTFLISKVSNELFNVCYIFSDNSGKKLLQAYKKYVENQPYSDKDIRQIMPQLPEAINNLQIASANLFWQKNDKSDDKKDKKILQMEFLRAAQYGKTFLQKEEFDFNKFNEICKDIRILNNLRNHPWQPRFITYDEYKQMKNLVKKILSQQNFSLSFKIAQYFDFEIPLIYQKYAISNIKKLPYGCSKEEEEKLYTILYYKLKDIPNISYITIAKKAFKYDKNEIGMKFLEHEKSILIKIPQYIEHCKWDKALFLAFETCDKNVLNTVFDKMLIIEGIDEFTSIISKHPKIHQPAIEFIKNYINKNKTETEKSGEESKKLNIEIFLSGIKAFDDYFFYLLERFFKSNSILERRKCLKKAKQLLSNKVITKPNFNYKFYKNYLNDLDSSLDFKANCMDKKINIIKKTDLNSFDNSLYDCFMLGVKADKYDWIETQNKKIFEMGNKRLSYLRLKGFAEAGKMALIDETIKKYTLKKMGLSPLLVAELFMEYKEYDKAVEYIKQIKEGQFFNYKIDMLKHMEKYVDALEAIISDKDYDKNIFMINEILNKRPDLKQKANELFNKYNK